MRFENRQHDELRPVRVERHYASSAPGSVLVQAGETTILCTASIDDELPPWKANSENPTGWVTAEYSMLPGSTDPRKKRERGKVDSRSSEIQRLIGRSLRSVVDFAQLGARTITVDCDVLCADGGTRTLSITGGFIALIDALRSREDELPALNTVLIGCVAAISVGIVDGKVLLDLDYSEDVRAEVDMNVVMTGVGEFIEIQGTAESGAFGRDLLDQQLSLAEAGIAQLTTLQRDTMGAEWPLD